MRSPRHRRLALGSVLLLLALGLMGLFVVGHGPGAHVLGEHFSSGVGFTISGDVNGLTPGVTNSTITLTVDNPLNVGISVTGLAMRVPSQVVNDGSNTTSDCLNGGLVVNGTPVTSATQDVVLPLVVQSTTGSYPTNFVPARSGSRDGLATESVPVVLDTTRADNSCKDVNFTFRYSGTAAYKALTSTTVNSGPNPSLFGQPVTLTATVKDQTTSTPAAVGSIGSVVFYQCSTTPPTTGPNAGICPAGSWIALSPTTTPDVLSSTGTAAFTTSLLPGGTDYVFAAFTPSAGNADDYTTSTSTAITQQVHFSQACLVNQTLHSYTVGSGQSVCIKGGQVGGGLTVRSGGSLFITGTTVNGGLTATSAGSLEVCSSTIHGGVSVTGDTGYTLIGDDGDDLSPACAGNSVDGGVTLANNSGSFELGKNSITGGLTVSNNVASPAAKAGLPTEDQAPEIEANTISGGLTCATTNRPAVVDDHRPNASSGTRTGQCVGGF